MKKKILSIILSVVMIVTFVPRLTAKAGTIITVKSETFKSNKDDDSSVRQQFSDGEHMSAGQQHFNDGNGSHTIAGEFRSSDDSGASDWAIDEIESAIENDLVTDSVTYDYQANITREEFCELVILLYEKLTGEIAEVGPDVFYDTSNRSVRKAYNLGIVNGVSSDRFAPDNFITRQEICAMLVRAIGAIYTGIDLDDYDYTSFADGYSISSWAMDAVQFAYDNDIMRGVGNGKINPLGNTTCEQAILLVNRIYLNRHDFEDMDDEGNERLKEQLEKENEKNKIKTLNLRNDDEVEAVSVTFDDGRNASSVKIKEVTDDDDMIYTTTGILGSAVDITYSKRFDGATISFEYNEEGLGDVNPSDLAIGWYNTDLDRVEILSSRVDTYSHTVSVETTHFSRYILVDSKEWYSVWQKGQMIVRETDKNGNYAEDFNVQLVVDCSGSMDGDRIVKARECTLEFINKLSLYDMFSVIKFGSEAVTVIDPVSVLDANMDEVEQVVMSLSDGGGTNFDNALRECLNVLKSTDVDYDDYNNIIVFLSDGGSAVSDSLLKELSDKGIRIAAVALGSGSDSERMKHLSDMTNGQYIYAESSEALDTIFDAIQGSLIGVDATDTDGDGIPDIIEVTGMKNQYGAVIRTDPYEYDTDGDGDSDGEEMGSLVETDEVTGMDRANGITKNVYFQMVSNPLDGVRDTDFKLDDERTLGEFSGLPGHLTLTAGDEHWIELNRANAKLSIDDESIATIEPGIDVGNIDGTVNNWTNFKICPKESGEATLTATAPNGQKLKCKLTVNAKVGIVSSDATIIDSEGKFTLKLNIDVEGTAKNMTLEFKKLDDCLSYSWSQGDYDAFGGDFTALVDLDGISGGGFILEEYSSGKHEEELRFTCSNTEDLGRCDNGHEILIKVYGDNFEPSEYTAKIYTQEEWEEHQREIERQNEERRRREMNKDINAMQQDIAIDAYDLITILKNNAENKAINDTDIVEAINEIKEHIHSDDKNVPDAVYEALAKSIYDTIKASNIDKYDKNPNEFVKQNFVSAMGGLKGGETKTVTIDGCEYNVEYSVFAQSYGNKGAGVCIADVHWTDARNRYYSANLNWASDREAAEEALKAYCIALAELNKDCWEDFLVSYTCYFGKLTNIKVLQDKDKIQNALDGIEKVIKAVDGDKEAADSFVEDLCNAVIEKYAGSKLDEGNKICENIRKELKSSLFNGGKFKKYIIDNVPNGEQIAEAAKLYFEVKEKYEALRDAWNKDPESKNALELYNEMSSLLDELEKLLKSI